MNLRHLRTFTAIVDAGGIHRAAGRLNLTQPAASRHIQALEAELGVLLFDRIGRRLHLTSEGEDMLRRSRRLQTEAESLTERASALRRGDSWPLTLKSLLPIWWTTAGETTPVTSSAAMLHSYRDRESR